MMFFFWCEAARLLALLSIVPSVLSKHALKHRHPIDPRAEQTICGTVTVVTTVYIVLPIHIDLYVSQNTTLSVYDWFTLNIDNAPTSINSVYTGTTTSLITQSENSPDQFTTHSSPQFSYVNGYSFILALNYKDNNGKAKRQNAILLGNGQATDSCTNAVIYSLVSGQLWANTSTSAQQFGTNANVQYANFTPSTSPGSITTVFSVDSQNNLLWSNAAFYNNQARFCVLADNTIVSVFSDPSLAPDGCVFVTLGLARVSTCAAAVGVQQLSGPAGPAGPSGPAGAQGIQGISGASGLVGAIGPTGPTGKHRTDRAYWIARPHRSKPQAMMIGMEMESFIVENLDSEVYITSPLLRGVRTDQEFSQYLRGPSGPQGLSGLIGATGPIGPSGLSGLPGLVGPSGPSGPKGSSFTFAYLGCFPQGCSPVSCPNLASYTFDSPATFGGYTNTFTGNATASIPSQCAAACLTKGGANFFGVVNNGTTQGDCYCGVAVTVVLSGVYALTNCVTCNGQSTGECGKQATSLAVYGRAF